MTDEEKKAFEALARSFTRSYTRMETLYKIKRNEVDRLTAENERLREEVDSLSHENDELEYKTEKLEDENAELKARLERAIELPYVKRDCELTQIIYKNSYGDMEEETYFHDCYYGQGHDIRGDVYAEARLAELKGGRSEYADKE